MDNCTQIMNRCLACGPGEQFWKGYNNAKFPQIDASYNSYQTNGGTRGGGIGGTGGGGEEKARVVAVYKASIAKKQCKYILVGSTCPFGSSCFYLFIILFY